MEVDFEWNEVTKKLPKHLHKFIVKQPYDQYTSQNQAVWRYVMRINVDYLGEVAHSSYLNGIEKAGISIENIPRMEGMNRILKEIGWAAVSVDGFIPPNAFMEFQAYNVLVIASEIRTFNHIEYTPAPDIIHEAAGHAPIIANPEYAEYLRRFGEIGSKAISSAKDYELYEAIRLLSILKEDPNSSEQEIKQAEDNLNFIQKNMGEPSEMAKIRNLHWWTVEYGLIGDLNNPKIYGAGLLSSIGESKSCMLKDVIKLPYTVSASTINFDITKPQPQLFVTPNFADLNAVLEEFANTMAVRTGGTKGVEKLVESKNIGTIELSSGIQISGIFSNIIKDGEGEVAYVQITGETALAYRDKELIGHGVDYHKEGFGSPIGKLKGIPVPFEKMNSEDLEIFGIHEGKHIELDFESGVHVSGTIIKGTRNIQGDTILVSFKDCVVTFYDEILFQPEWGVYDMAIGMEIISAFAGPADSNSFEKLGKISENKTRKIEYSDKDKELHKLYDKVRKMREENLADDKSISDVYDTILSNYPQDWLLLLELYELCIDNDFTVEPYLFSTLQSLKKNKAFTNLIERGLALL